MNYYEYRKQNVVSTHNGYYVTIKDLNENYNYRNIKITDFPLNEVFNSSVNVEYKLFINNGLCYIRLRCDKFGEYYEITTCVPIGINKELKYIKVDYRFQYYHELQNYFELNHGIFLNERYDITRELEFANKLDEQYIKIANEIMDYGIDSDDRTGTGTRRLLGKQIRHNMMDGLPIITTKKVFTKGVITELLWFLSGNTNIKYLVDNGNYIWIGDCYKKYNEICNVNTDEYNHFMRENSDGSFSLYTREQFIERIKTDDEDSDFNQKFASIGKGYGYQWVNADGINQIQKAIDTLKTNPYSRKNIVSAWNVNDLDEMLLEPCHFAFQLVSNKAPLDLRVNYMKNYSKGYYNDYISLGSMDNDHITKYLDDLGIPDHYVSLHWNQRSADFLLGIPFNILSYGLLLLMISQQVNMIPYELVGSIGDCHIYKNQMDIYNEFQRFNRGKKLPIIMGEGIDFGSNSDAVSFFQLKKANDIFSYKLEDFSLINYNSDGNIKYPLSN